MGQPKHPPAERGRQAGEIRRAPRQTCKSLEVRMRSFHDLPLPYDVSQIDRTARVTHSDPCSHTGDCFQIGALGRGSGRQCAGAAVMKKATARERLAANTPRFEDRKSTCSTYTQPALRRVPPLTSRLVREPFDAPG